MPGPLGGWGAHLLNWRLLGEQEGKVGARRSGRCESRFQRGIPAGEDSCRHQRLKGVQGQKVKGCHPRLRAPGKGQRNLGERSPFGTWCLLRFSFVSE